MMRGTFANIRIKNQLVKNDDGSVVEGGYTIHQPTGERMFIYDAAMRYQQEGKQLVIFAGKEYGTGSSRDWAAKGTTLLGVRAVVAESFERIHRSNLIGMGVLPLQFQNGQTWAGLGLTGAETVSIDGVAGLGPRQKVTLKIGRPNGNTDFVEVQCRIDTENEVEYFRNGGILHYVVRLLSEPQPVTLV
jgi:aconitate hydratase